MADRGAYVGREWVSVAEALTLLHPDPEGPGAYEGRRWICFTCAKCGEAPARCPHRKGS